jgi:phosphomannomutase/phosphomannomutase/phosphoglucomutase
MQNDVKEKLSCFKAYDVRGRVPEELDVELAFRIGQAYQAFVKAKQIVIGYDIRPSSPELAAALSKGLMAGGAEVLDIGICGTEEVYFGTADLHVDGGIMVTASHNPANYNGMKFVGMGARPIGSDSGLREIERIVTARALQKTRPAGSKRQVSIRPRYIEHILGYVETASLKPLKAVVNGGNGCAGPLIDLLERQLPIEFVKIMCEPDGSFPNGVPNPLLPENRESTSRAVIESGADLGIAWDGDFDRCFMFDENGEFVEGYYLVGLLAQTILSDSGQGERIVHDPRLIWNTEEIVTRAGGVPVMSRTGHVFIKEVMRQADAVYGGEMSGHHYFRDFFYCDSGMIPWLLVCQLISRSGLTLSEMVDDCKNAYPVSGEINRVVDNPDKVIARIEEQFMTPGCKMDYTDGLSMSFGDYRFNVRKSNTEPVLRLNVESHGDQALLEKKTSELLQLIEGAC